MITFKVVFSDDEPMVLILRDDKLIAALHRYGEGKIRLTSKYLDGVERDSAEIPGLIIKLKGESK